MKHRLSSDWMGKLRDETILHLPEECIAKFGKGYGRKEAGRKVAEKESTGKK